MERDRFSPPSSARARSPAILDLLDDWSADPTFVVRKILLSPGCPDFPPDQWLNIVKGYAVNLSKVLGAHYSSDVEAK